ncbi:type IV secretory system conjugative DNA transfer family protein [Sphingomonas sp. CFBP 13706]|uniref:type IV secretory system conjugative DNA transfer family protein n=1 Tax=Sphingomonas sp. CFBP 13706 TaxID=2775314 RepID=UPI0018D979D3|nr:type IV secretory system conjugative DNA transfer family protein [Sphingomonas sp. CFBP 13706]
MIRIWGKSPATKTAVVVCAVIVFAVLSFVIGVFIALAALKQLNSHMSFAAIPKWVWYYRYDPILQTWLMRGSFLASALVAIGALLLFRNTKSLHGEARFANTKEIETAGLRSNDGILLGKFAGRWLTTNSEAHVLLEAPTGAGKGVGIVIPNLLNWAGSVVCLDMKQENFNKTAGFRAKHGQAVHLFDPVNREGLTSCYNPIGYIDRADPVQVVDELQKIGAMLFAAPEKGDPFWAEAARTAFVGVGTWLAATPTLPFTIGEIYRSITTGDPKTRFAQEIIDREAAGKPLSIACITALSDFTSASDNTFSGIKQSVTTKLGLWLNPYIDKATATSDFDLRELRLKPMSIYLGATVNNIDRLAPLYNLIFQQIVDLNTDSNIGEYDPKTQHRCLILLDEFAKLGRVPVIVSAISFVRSYGLNLLIVVQNKAQLKDGADEISANSDVTVVYTPKEFKDAKDISDRLGTHGLGAKSKSRGGSLFGQSNNSVSESEHARALMLPQEVLSMPLDEILIFKRGVLPIKAAKLIYYKMEEFTSRLLPAPKVQASDASALPPPSWVDKAPRDAGAVPPTPPTEPAPAAPGGAAADAPADAPQQASPAPRELTDEEIDSPALLDTNALILGDDDPFEAIKAGADKVVAVENWLANVMHPEDRERDAA